MNFEITESAEAHDQSECPKTFHAEKVVGYDWDDKCEKCDDPKVSNFTAFDNFGICDQDFQRETHQSIQNWLETQKAKSSGLWVWEPKEYKYRSNYDI